MNMAENNVTRSPLRILRNTLPNSYIGQWLSDVQRLEFRIKPAFDNDIVSLEVSPLLLILDAQKRIEKFRFQTQTIFEFSGLYSSFHLQSLVYYLLCVSVDEFNVALQNSGSLLSFGRQMQKPELIEMEPLISKALRDREGTRVAGIIPYWKTENNSYNSDNDKIIEGLPAVPPYKQFAQNSTEERSAIAGCTGKNTPSHSDLQVIEDAISFYKTCFAELEKIDLAKLTDVQAGRLKTYLDSVFTTTPFLSNDLQVGEIYRATVVDNDFCEHGKVRDYKFLRYPPLDILKKKGVYNRCSSCHLNLFYASEQKNLPFREIRPSKGSRVIASTWLNHSGTMLHYHPLCLAPGIFNANTDRATLAFEQLFDKLHPVVVSWMQTIFAFITRQFVKESGHNHPLRYEYFYSAYFSDRNMQSLPPELSAKQVECIVYPSVAWEHIPSNIAIHPDILDKKFILVDAKEYEIVDTWYDRIIGLQEYPLKMTLIRSSKQIKNGRISWDDD